MQLNDIKRNTKNKTKKRVGRGGTRGKTSGKGHKGQNARAGRKKRPEMRDVIKKIPKMRGYKFNSFREKPEIVNLLVLEINFKDGETVSPEVLVGKKILGKKKGKMPKVKILSKGEISKKLNFEGCIFSKTAEEKIKKAGGTIKEEVTR